MVYFFRSSKFFSVIVSLPPALGRLAATVIGGKKGTEAEFDASRSRTCHDVTEVKYTEGYNVAIVVVSSIFSEHISLRMDEKAFLMAEDGLYLPLLVPLDLPWA